MLERKIPALGAGIGPAIDKGKQVPECFVGFRVR